VLDEESLFLFPPHSLKVSATSWRALSVTLGSSGYSMKFSFIAHANIQTSKYTNTIKLSLYQNNKFLEIDQKSFFCCSLSSTQTTSHLFVCEITEQNAHFYFLIVSKDCHSQCVSYFSFFIFDSWNCLILDTGTVSTLSNILSKNGISLFYLSTANTDFVLVHRYLMSLKMQNVSHQIKLFSISNIRFKNLN
jgi:hypothetical protein